MTDIPNAPIGHNTRRSYKFIGDAKFENVLSAMKWLEENESRALDNPWVFIGQWPGEKGQSFYIQLSKDEPVDRGYHNHQASQKELDPESMFSLFKEKEEDDRPLAFPY